MSREHSQVQMLQGAPGIPQYYGSQHRRFHATCSTGNHDVQGSRLSSSCGPSLRVHEHVISRNRARKQSRHFSKVQAAYETPLPSVPRAPENFEFLLTPGHLPEGRGLMTPHTAGCFRSVTPNPFKPGTAWKNGFGMVDKDAAEVCNELGLDIFGSNAALLMSEVNAPFSAGMATGSDDDDDPFGFGLRLDDSEDLEDPSSTLVTPVLPSPAFVQGGHQSFLHLPSADFQRELKVMGRDSANCSASDETHHHASCG